jgi:apolipoprotein D and lipocalin family protein
MKRLLIILFAGLVLAGCATSGQDTLAPKTVKSVNLKRYQGTWYELAHYTLKPDGNVAVLNRCLTAQWQWEEVKGTAYPQVPGKSDKLWVEFDTWFSRLIPGTAKGEYWVLYVSDDYKTAIVGDPSRKYLWLLSRTPTVNGVVREELLSKARQQGYDTTRLIWRASEQQMAKTSN